MKLIARFITPVLFTLLTLGFTTQAANAQSATQRYAAQHRDMVLDLSQEFEIPPAVIMAVAIIESGSGQTRNCRDLKNHFGVVGRNNVARRTRYKQYENLQESFRDFCGIISRKSFYSKLKGNSDPYVWLKAISRAGYSELPDHWLALTTGVVKKNKL